jgi:hypothetical protein
VVRRKVTTGYPSAFSSAPSMSRLSRGASNADVKITLPLAMNVSTSASFSRSKTRFKAAIFTTRPPALIARRNAT